MVILLKPDKARDEAFIKAISSRIKSLSFEDTDDGKSFLKLELDNSDLTLLEYPAFLDATSFFIQWGDADNLTPMRKVSIKKIAGFLALTVEGVGALWKDDQLPVKKLWEVQDITQIVETIAKSMGYATPDIQKPDDYYFVTFQQHEPNSRFLARLAREVGYAFWVDTNLHWKARDAQGSPTITLVFRGTTSASVPGYVIGEPTVKYEFTRDNPGDIKGTAPVDKVKGEGSVCQEDGLNPLFVKAFMSENGTSPKPKVKYSMNSYGTLQYSSEKEKKDTVFAEPKQLPEPQKAAVYTPTGKPQKATGAWRGKQNTSSIEVNIRGVGYLSVGDVVLLANFGSINEGKWYARKIKHTVGPDGFTQSLTLSRSSIKKTSDKLTSINKTVDSGPVCQDNGDKVFDNFMQGVAGKVNSSNGKGAVLGQSLPEFKEESIMVKDENGTMQKVIRKVPWKDGK